MARVHSVFSTAMLCAFAFACSITTLAQDSTSAPNDTEGVTQSVQELPDSPGAVWAKSQTPAPPAAAPSPGATQSESPAAGQSSPDQNPPNKDGEKKDERLQRPVGTAAAEAPKVSGITAAEPAGAAIAPAKQHRVRTLVIKVGAILGAGAAIGTVVALSAATPSKPPGAH